MMRIEQGLLVRSGTLVIVFGNGCMEDPESSASRQAQGVSLEVGDDERGGPMVVTVRTTEDLRALASDYLFKEVDGDQAEAALERIRALSGPEADVFHEIVGDMSGLQGIEREIFDAAHMHARELGVSFLDLTEEDQNAVLARVTGLAIEEVERAGRQSVPDALVSAEELNPQAICIPPWVSCSYNSNWSKTLYPTCCGPDCTTGNQTDRVGNEACEPVACDFRMRFPDNATTNIDGTTCAAICVVDYYGGLIAYSNASYTFALSGVLGPGVCGLSTSGMHQKFRVF